MAADENTVPPTDDVQLGRKERVSELLNDGKAREVLIQRLVEGDHMANGPAALPPNGGAGTFLNAFPVPSGSGNGGSLWPSFLMQFPFAAPFPPFWPGPWTVATPPMDQSLPGSASSQGQPGSSSTQGQVQGEEDDDDVLELLDDKEAREFTDFDPTVNNDNDWDAGEVINTFLKKHSGRAVTADERQAIMKDFPKQSCWVLRTPKLNENMKRQIKKAGKDPLFGQERSLFKLHDQLVDMAGPLTCLWADIANKEAKVNPHEVILLVQRVLVLLGSAAYSVKQERMKVAWSRINPSTLGLLQEDTEEDKEENTLFGSGFLERAAKRMEEEKALAKVTGTRPGGNTQKRQGDPNDLRRSLERGAPARYGGRNSQRHQPYPRTQPPPKTSKGKGKKVLWAWK